MAKKSSNKTSDDEDETTCRRTSSVDGQTVNSVDHLSTSRPKSPTSEEASHRAAVMSVDFDAILKHIGEMGPYQLVLYLMMCIPATLPAAFLAFNQESFFNKIFNNFCHRFYKQKASYHYLLKNETAG